MPTSTSGNVSRTTWTPARGLARAAFFGALAAAGLVVVTDYLSDATHGVFSQSLPLSLAAAFVGAWILFSVVHAAAGMVGVACTALVVTLATLVAVGAQAHLASSGLLMRAGPNLGEAARGWGLAFSPMAIFYMVLPKATVIAVCAWIRHDGGGDIFDLGAIAGTRMNVI